MATVTITAASTPTPPSTATRLRDRARDPAPGRSRADRRQAQKRARDEPAVQVRPQGEQPEDRQGSPPDVAPGGLRLAAIPPKQKEERDQDREDEHREARRARMDHREHAREVERGDRDQHRPPLPAAEPEKQCQRSRDQDGVEHGQPGWAEDLCDAEEGQLREPLLVQPGSSVRDRREWVVGREPVLGDEPATVQRQVEVAVVETVQTERERADERDQGTDQGPCGSRGQPPA